MSNRIVSLFRNLLRKNTIEQALDDELRCKAGLARMQMAYSTRGFSSASQAFGLINAASVRNKLETASLISEKHKAHYSELLIAVQVSAR